METIGERLAGNALEASANARRATRLHRVLVATHGEASAEPALRFAGALAAETGAEVELTAVFTPRVPVPSQAAARRVQCEQSDRGRVAELACAVRRQRRGISAASVSWPIRLAVGDPANALFKLARDDEFDIIVLGLGRPDPARRLHGDETALRIALSTSIPVLAVAPGATGRPQRAVMVVDAMDDVDRRMVDTVVALLAPVAELHIALTGSRQLDGASAVRIAREAGVPHSVPLFATPVPSEGSAVIELAQRVGADLIAAPSHGRTPEERLLIQDLIVPLLRSAHCSVLSVPPAPQD